MNDDNFRWFASANQERPYPAQEQYIDKLAHVPHKVDVLLRVDNIAALVQSELMERLSRHPKVGTLIIHGLPRAQRPLVITGRGNASGPIFDCTVTNSGNKLLVLNFPAGMVLQPVDVHRQTMMIGSAVQMRVAAGGTWLRIRNRRASQLVGPALTDSAEAQKSTTPRPASSPAAHGFGTRAGRFGHHHDPSEIIGTKQSAR